MHITPRPVLSGKDQAWLRKQAASAVTARRLVERCQIVLRAAEGGTNEQIAAALGITPQKDSRWRARFVEGGRAGLEQDAPGCGRKAIDGPQIQQLMSTPWHSAATRRARSGRWIAHSLGCR